MTGHLLRNNNSYLDCLARESSEEGENRAKKIFLPYTFLPSPYTNKNFFIVYPKLSE